MRCGQDITRTARVYRRAQAKVYFECVSDAAVSQYLGMTKGRAGIGNHSPVMMKNRAL
jgi:hypothetical protein